jgi:AcrR family transcriptional regulator
MNTVITSKEEILLGSLRFVSANSLAALDMRSLANFLNVSVGTLYHYFPSKDKLIQESVQRVFMDIFKEEKLEGEGFVSYLHSLYDDLAAGERKYPGFFSSHSFVFEEKNLKEAKERKLNSRNAVKEQMRKVLVNDKKVSKEAFKNLDMEAFIDLTFDSLLYSFLEKKDEMKTLDEMVRRVIYLKEDK